MKDYPTHSHKTPTHLYRWGLRSSQCELCDAQFAVLYHNTGSGTSTYLCAACARKAALRAAARHQMSEMLDNVVQAWHDTWGDVEGVASISELLSSIGTDLEARYEHMPTPQQHQANKEQDHDDVKTS